MELYGCLHGTGIVNPSFNVLCLCFGLVRKPFDKSESESQSQSENTVFKFLWHSMNRALNKITTLVHVF